MCGSRRELSNAYLLAKIGVDTAENEPLEVWGENSIQYSLHSLTCVQHLQLGSTPECFLGCGQRIFLPWRSIDDVFKTRKSHWLYDVSQLAPASTITGGYNFQVCLGSHSEVSAHFGVCVFLFTTSALRRSAVIVFCSPMLQNSALRYNVTVFSKTLVLTVFHDFSVRTKLMFVSSDVTRTLTNCAKCPFISGECGNSELSGIFTD